MSGATRWIAGVDLAWGEASSDAVCLLSLRHGRATVAGYAYLHGDAALLGELTTRIPARAPALLAIDAPIVCPNPSGTRPVDREISRRFWREHAGCHSANARLCPRPARIATALVGRGFAIGHDLARARRLVAEVYPHPAMVRLLRLPRIVKYKRGPVEVRRAEFAHLQGLLRGLVATEFDFLEIGDETRRLLAEPWSKPVEDLTDAFFCALVGLWHVRHRGRRSEVLGSLESGFVLLPEDLRASSSPASLAYG